MEGKLDIDIEPHIARMVSMQGTYILLIKYPLSAEDLHKGLGKYFKHPTSQLSSLSNCKSNLKDWQNVLGFKG